MKRSAPLARKSPLKRTSAFTCTGPGLERRALAARSEKQKLVSVDLAAVYAHLARTRPLVCSGCGKAQGGHIKLSHSHLVPRSYNARLIAEPANVTYHCLDWGGHEGCHTKWESNTKRHALLDYERNMAYIEQADPAYYRLLVLKTVI